MNNPTDNTVWQQKEWLVTQLEKNFVEQENHSASERNKHGFCCETRIINIFEQWRQSRNANISFGKLKTNMVTSLKTNKEFHKYSSKSFIRDLTQISR